jgi:hypothetical protein
MRAFIAVAVVSLSTAAIAQTGALQPRVQELLDRGFTIAAEGPLLESVECRRWTMRIFPKPKDEPCFGKVTYGSFKRLKNDTSEFVCISFREWACYPGDKQS